jgi:hypothetical protein
MLFTFYRVAILVQRIHESVGTVSVQNNYYGSGSPLIKYRYLAFVSSAVFSIC